MEDFELEPGESIVKLVRKHWFIFVLQFIPFAVLALLPLFISPVLHYVVAVAPPGVGLSSISVLTTGSLLLNPWIRVALGIWWLLIWLAAFNVFTNYFLEAWLITSERIVNIDQQGFFRREVSSLLLDRVQDVTTNVDGFLATVIDYGSIQVQTAGTQERFIMSGIPDAKGLRDIILREVTRVQEGSGQKSTGGV